MKRKALSIIFAVVLACAFMALVETVLRPGYLVKSCIKWVLFLGLSIGSLRGSLRREGLGLGLCLGGGIFAVILAAFFLFRDFIDLRAIADGLLGKEGISRENFLWVALYISICNSFLEELLFRGILFRSVFQKSPVLAYILSMAAFSMIHLLGYDYPSLGHWGLAFVQYLPAGFFFAFAYHRSGSIYSAILAHMANNLLAMLLS